MRASVLLGLIFSLNLLCFTQSARILVLYTLPGRSHYILGSSLSRALAERGHDVTMVSCFKEKDPPKNGTYRDITLEGFFEKMQEEMKDKMNMFDIEDSNAVLFSVFMVTMFQEMSDNVLKSKEVQQLLSSKEQFDVVIVEQFVNDAQKAFATHFNAPLILVSSLGANFWVDPLVGNPSPPSYVPDIMLPYSSHMTFCERVKNCLVRVLNNLIYHLYHFPQQNKAIKKYFPNGPDIDDVLYNASLVLLNSHPSVNQPVPHVPNMIEIGGFHIKPTKKLPKDLQEFLDNAKEGVIYFSMGSNLKSAELPLEKREAFLRTFAKLKEKVLWKWEEDVLPGQPPNVKLSKWFPQQEILAHPNVKLFITHGGLLSTTETVYHGVPILAIPIFGDQKMNAKTAINNGYGLSISFKQLSEELLTKTINELLTNPKYRNNAKYRSMLFHDRQVSPMDTAIYWIEYVIRHKGAPHLRVAALDLPWYKYLLLDVIAFVGAVSLVLLAILYFITKKVFSWLFGKQKQKKIKKN